MNSAAFVLMAALHFANGTVVEAVGETFATEEQCTRQAEKDAQEMAATAFRIEQTLPEEGLREIVMYCQPVRKSDNHTGYIPTGRNYGE